MKTFWDTRRQHGFRIASALGLAIIVALGVAPVGRVLGGEVNSELTHGNVQLHLKVGQTTQAEIIEVFGAPNITTIDGQGREVWVYRRHATVSSLKSKSGGFLIGLGGGGGGFGAGGGLSYGSSKTGFEQASRAMTLVIKFDEDKVVSDFRSRSSSF